MPKHDISRLKLKALLWGCREHTNFVNCIRFSLDGSKFLSVGSDKNGFLFDGKTGEMLGTLSSEDGHTGSIYAASWSPNGKQVNLNSLRWQSLGVMGVLWFHSLLPRTCTMGFAANFMNIL